MPSSNSDDVRRKLAQTAIDTAKAAAGTDYTVGGKTLSGFDCSGFAYYVFHRVFPDFNYMTAAEIGMSSSFSEVTAYRPGDLVFFPAGAVPYEVRHHKNNKVFPDHVGILVDHGHWISSQSSTGPDAVALNNIWWGSRPMKFLKYIKLS